MRGLFLIGWTIPILLMFFERYRESHSVRIRRLPWVMFLHGLCAMMVFHASNRLWMFGGINETLAFAVMQAIGFNIIELLKFKIAEERK